MDHFTSFGSDSQFENIVTGDFAKQFNHELSRPMDPGFYPLAGYKRIESPDEFAHQLVGSSPQIDDAFGRNPYRNEISRPKHVAFSNLNDNQSSAESQPPSVIPINTKGSTGQLFTQLPDQSVSSPAWTAFVGDTPAVFHLDENYNSRAVCGNLLNGDECRPQKVVFVEKAAHEATETISVYDKDVTLVDGEGVVFVTGKKSLNIKLPQMDKTHQKGNHVEAKVIRVKGDKTVSHRLKPSGNDTINGHKDYRVPPDGRLITLYGFNNNWIVG